MIETLTTTGNITPERLKILKCLEEKPYDSISDLCKDAGVVRNVYYDAIQSEDFVKMLFDNSSAGIYVAIPQILDKIIRQAKNGSFLHQKMLLEMMKIYQGTPAVAIQQNIQNNYQVTPEEVKEGWIKAGLDNKEWLDELIRQQSLVD